MLNDRAVNAEDCFIKLFVELDFFIWYLKGLIFLKIGSLIKPAQFIGGGPAASAYALNEKAKRRTKRNEWEASRRSQGEVNQS